MTQRELTVYHLAKHSPFLPSEITKLMRLAATHRRLCEMECNGEGTTVLRPRDDGYGNPVPRSEYGWGDRDEAKRKRVEERIADVCNLPIGRCRPGDVRARFQYDPRGATVKIAVPDGFTDDWGKEGICL